MAIIAADIGNSRIKLGLFSAPSGSAADATSKLPQPEREISLPALQWDNAMLEAWLSDATLRRDHIIKKRLATQGKADLDNAMAKGNSLLGQGNYAQAAVEFQKAMKAGGDLVDWLQGFHDILNPGLTLQLDPTT